MSSARWWWSHSAWGGVHPFSTGEGTGTMSNMPSWDYRIMHRHLSSSCVPLFVSHSRHLQGEQISTKFGSIETIMIQWCRMWNKPDTMGFCPLVCQLLQHTNQSVLLFLTHHHFHDPFFFTSRCSALCEGRGGRAVVSMTFSPLGKQGGGCSKSQAEVMWPAETQAAGVEKLPSLQTSWSESSGLVSA